MVANCTKLTERILQLTLEIIYLLTGENNIVAKKTSGDRQDPITVPLHFLLIPERNNDGKILEVINRMSELLMGKVSCPYLALEGHQVKNIKVDDASAVEHECVKGDQPCKKEIHPENETDGSSNGNPPERCPRPLYSRDSTQKDLTIPQNHESGTRRNCHIGIKEEIKVEEEEWEYLEEHQDLYKYDLMASQPALTSPDGSSNGNPPERCPRPLYSRDSTQGDLTIPHHHQHEEQIYVKVEVKEENEEVGVMDYVEEDGMMANLKQEDSLLIIAAGSSNGNPPEKCPCPLYSRDSTQEDHTIPHHHQGKELKDVKVELKEEEEPFLRGDEQFTEEGGPLYSRDSTEEDHNIPHHHQNEEQIYVKVEVKEEKEELCVMVYKQSTEEEGMKANIKQEESLHIMADGSSNGNPPERCPHPLYSRNSTQEDLIIPHHHQEVEVFDIKTEIKEEEETCVRADQLSMKESEMMVAIKKEDSSLDIRLGGHGDQNTSEGRLITPSDYNAANGVVQYSLGTSLGTQYIHKSLDDIDDKSHTLIPDIQLSSHSIEPSNPKDCSYNNLDTVNPRNKKDDFRFSCPQCGKRFTKKTILQIHLMGHSGKKIYSCPECENLYLSNCGLVAHKRIHAGEKSFKCPDCGECFGLKSQLTVHQITHAKHFPCSVCGKTFIKIEQLAQHQKRHNRIGTWSNCNIARKKIKVEEVKHLEGHKDNVIKGSQQSLTSPDGSSNGNPPERCPRPLYSPDSTPEDHNYVQPDQGVKVFEVKEEAGMMVTTGGHSGWITSEGHFISPSDYDGKAQYSPGASLDTQKIHNSFEDMESSSDSFIFKESNDKSPTCSPNFQRSFHADGSPGPSNSKKSSYHMLNTVTPRKNKAQLPFSCPQCGKCFEKKYVLRVHLLGHAGKKIYSCPECENLYLSNCGLVAHKRLHAGEKSFKCPECGECFGLKSELTTHQTEHFKPLNCTKCGITFIKIEHLVKHQRGHPGRKPYACPECEKSFTFSMHLKRHYLVHTGLKPFACPKCWKSFSTKANLDIHLRVHNSKRPNSC